MQSIAFCHRDHSLGHYDHGQCDYCAWICCFSIKVNTQNSIVTATRSTHDQFPFGFGTALELCFCKMWCNKRLFVSFSFIWMFCYCLMNIYNSEIEKNWYINKRRLPLINELTNMPNNILLFFCMSRFIFCTCLH